jgi:hypothetical protein
MTDSPNLSLGPDLHCHVANGCWRDPPALFHFGKRGYPVFELAENVLLRAMASELRWLVALSYVTEHSSGGLVRQREWGRYSTQQPSNSRMHYHGRA